MKRRKLSRRDILQGLPAALALGAVFASPARAEAPPPVAITPHWSTAAKKEGKVILYSSMDLPVGEKLGKAFEAAYPGISVQIERSGSERLFQRVDQEFASGIRAADIINSSDASHFISWKKNKLAGAFRTGRHGATFSAGVSRPRRHVRDVADLFVVDRLQHQSGEARGRAEELCRPARSEMGRQDGQGPSGL